MGKDNGHIKEENKSEVLEEFECLPLGDHPLKLPEAQQYGFSPKHHPR